MITQPKDNELAHASHHAIRTMFIASEYTPTRASEPQTSNDTIPPHTTPYSRQGESIGQSQECLYYPHHPKVRGVPYGTPLYRSRY